MQRNRKTGPITLIKSINIKRAKNEMKEFTKKDISTTVTNNPNVLKNLKDNLNMRKWKNRNKNFIGYV